MRPTSKLWWLLTVLLLAASPALAQRGIHRVAAPTPVRIVAQHPASVPMPAPPVMRKIVVSKPSSTTSTTGGASTTDSGADDVFFFDGSPIGLDQLLNPVPGFGFSFEHLNAVNPDLGVKALIDPITEQRLALAERLLKETPFTPVSFPFFSGEPVVMLEQQQPPVIVLQQPQAAAQATSDQPPAAPEPSSAEAPAAPLHDVGTFVLVLRDGTKLDAVAFTTENDRLVYVTSDGVRRAIPASELDRSATEQLNDDRGTPVQLSQ